MDDHRRAGGDAAVDAIAHRGFAGRYPENTLAAFRAAAPDADAVELDVRPTADGDPVVFHDDRLDGRATGGLTDRSGLVRETPTDVVTGAEVLWSGETVPTLAAVVEAVPADTRLDVELKAPGTGKTRPDEALSGEALERARERWRSFVGRVLDDLADSPNAVRFSSFCEGALAAVRERSDAAVAPLVWRDLAAGLTIADRYDAAAIHVAWNLVAGTPFAGASYCQEPRGAVAAGREGPVAVDVDVVDRASDAGLSVAAWTVDTWYRADRLVAAGVDGLVVDYPGPADAYRESPR